MRIVGRVRAYLEKLSHGVIDTPPAVRLGDVLATYISESELLHLATATPDRRMIVGAVARMGGLDEAMILRAWSAQRGFDYLERIPIADFSILPPTLTPSMLLDYGATIMTEGDAVRQIVCIDPDRIDGIRQHLPTIPVAVARWDEVRRHGEESTRLADELGAARIQEGAHRLRETTEAVLGLVVHEVVDRGFSSVTIDLASEDPVYTIEAQTHGTARGCLHSILRPSLHSILGGGRIEVMMPSGARRTIEVVQEAGSQRYHLTWSGEEILFPRGDVLSSGTATTLSERSDVAVTAVVPSKTLFVVDDNPGFLEVVSRFLARQGFQVRTHRSAEEAWAALEGGVELDLIVCDVHMPGMNGYDFVRRLRATTVGRGIPIIALTSDDDVETEIRLIRAGVSAFVSKSADPRVLCAHVERWCDRCGGSA